MTVTLTNGGDWERDTQEVHSAVHQPQQLQIRTTTTIPPPPTSSLFPPRAVTTSLFPLESITASSRQKGRGWGWGWGEGEARGGTREQTHVAQCITVPRHVRWITTIMKGNWLAPPPPPPAPATHPHLHHQTHVANCTDDSQRYTL